MTAKAIVVASVFFALFVSAGAAAKPAPKAMVARLAELPAGFAVSTGTGYKSLAETANTKAGLAKYKAWGFVTAYEADFSRAGSLRGAIRVTASVSVYASPSGARSSLAMSVANCRRSPSKELSLGAKIGDEAHLCSVTPASSGSTLQVYGVLWRRGKLKAAVLTSGFVGTTSPSLAVSLAKIQDKRMR